MTHSNEEVARLYESSGSGLSGLRTDEAHSARMYDFLLGGKDNYPRTRRRPTRR